MYYRVSKSLVGSSEMIRRSWLKVQFEEKKYLVEPFVSCKEPPSYHQNSRLKQFLNHFYVYVRPRVGRKDYSGQGSSSFSVVGACDPCRWGVRFVIRFAIMERWRKASIPESTDALQSFDVVISVELRKVCGSGLMKQPEHILLGEWKVQYRYSSIEKAFGEKELLVKVEQNTSFAVI